MPIEPGKSHAAAAVLSQTVSNCRACTLASLYAGRIHVQSCAAAVQLLFSDDCTQAKRCCHLLPAGLLHLKNSSFP